MSQYEDIKALNEKFEQENDETDQNLAKYKNALNGLKEHIDKIKNFMQNAADKTSNKHARKLYIKTQKDMLDLQMHITNASTRIDEAQDDPRGKIYNIPWELPPQEEQNEEEKEENQLPSPNQQPPTNGI